MEDYQTIRKERVYLGGILYLFLDENFAYKEVKTEHMISVEHINLELNCEKSK